MTKHKPLIEDLETKQLITRSQILVGKDNYHLQTVVKGDRILQEYTRTIRDHVSASREWFSIKRIKNIHIGPQLLDQILTWFILFFAISHRINYRSTLLEILMDIN